jgi:Protein of unknown function (DUF4245)
MATAARPEPVVVSPSVYRRLMSGLSGYTMAMLSCLVVVGLVILITPRHNEEAIPHADYHGDLAGLIAVAPYPVLAPEGLPKQWFATSTRLTGRPGGPVSWHLGFNTARKEYAALEESNETPDGRGNFIDRMTSQGHPDGTAQVAGATWYRTFRPDKKQRSLVRKLPGVTIVVTGTASYDELAVLAGALRPQAKSARPAATPT